MADQWTEHIINNISNLQKKRFMKIQFAIQTYYDPFGDRKTDRRKFKKFNFESDLQYSEIREIVRRFNQGKYYKGISLTEFDKRIKTIQLFEKSLYYHDPNEQLKRYS